MSRAARFWISVLIVTLGIFLYYNWDDQVVREVSIFLGIIGVVFLLIFSFISSFLDYNPPIPHRYNPIRGINQRINGTYEKKR